VTDPILSKWIPLQAKLSGRRRARLPLAFLVLSFVVGTFLVFTQPPGQGLDEAAHFYRVWTLAQGTIVAPSQHAHAGGYVPQCIAEYFNRFATEAYSRRSFSINQYWHSPLGCSHKQVFVNFQNTAIDGPISYAPSIVAVAILRGIGASLPVIFFGGRFASLVAFVLIFYLAIRLIPRGKQVLFVLGLLPTMLLLASSYSADPMTIALAVLSVSLTMRCCLAPEKNGWAYLLLFLTLLGLSLTKNSMALFAPLLLMVPATVIHRRRHARLIQIAAVVAVVVIAGLWYLAIRNVLSQTVLLYGLNPPVQLRSVLHHPFGYVEVLARTFFDGKGQARWLTGFFYSIGYYRTDSVYASTGIVVVGSLTLWYAYQLQFGAKKTVDTGTRQLAWLPVVLVIVGILAIETSLYIVETPVGLLVTQAQGRYFYPLVPLPLLSIALLRENRGSLRSTRWIFLGSSIMLIWLILKIFVHDYAL
jgi:uncharacterized membrane protein